MTFEDFQIDIQPLFKLDTSQYEFEYIYYVRNTIVGNDQGSSLDQYNYDHCDPNPCQNGGTCSIGFKIAFSCFCPENFNGDLLLKNNDHNNNIFTIKQAHIVNFHSLYQMKAALIVAVWQPLIY
jgi:hypothetical protein